LFEVPNNRYSVCNCGCSGGFARDDSLPQHLAAVSQPLKELSQGKANVN
jgi:hypothetical protein